MHHVAEALDDEAFGHLHRTELRHAADVVAAEVEQHQVLGTFLGIGQQFGFQRLIFFVGRAAPPGAGERADGHDAVAQPHQDSGLRADDGEAAEIQEEQEGRRVDPPQRPIQREGGSAKGTEKRWLGTIWKASPAAMYSLQPAHRVHEASLGKVGGGRRHFGQHRPAAPDAATGDRARLGARRGAPARAVPGCLGADCSARGYTGAASVSSSFTLSKIANSVGRISSASGTPMIVAVLLRQRLHQPDHVVAEIADQTARHRRQMRGHVQTRLVDQRAQAFQRRAFIGDEGVRGGLRVRGSPRRGRRGSARPGPAPCR